MLLNSQHKAAVGRALHTPWLTGLARAMPGLQNCLSLQVVLDIFRYCALQAVSCVHTQTAHHHLPQVQFPDQPDPLGQELLYLTYTGLPLESPCLLIQILQDLGRQVSQLLRTAASLLAIAI